MGKVDHWWRLGFGLGRSELRQHSVWPPGIDVVQVDREDPAQMAFVDDQDPIEQLAAQGLRSCVRRPRLLGVLRVGWSGSGCRRRRRLRRTRW
jgi:hypothetical protein